MRPSLVRVLCLAVGLVGASCDEGSVEPDSGGSDGAVDLDAATCTASCSDFPHATNTGPPPGTVMEDYTGLYEVRTEGAVVNALKVTGAILVYANDVTIQNCEVDATGEIWGIAGMDVSGLIVKNCRVYGVPSRTDHDGTHVLVGIEGADEVAYCDIFGVENSVSSGSGHIHDNYLHDFPRWIANDDHTDGLQTYGHAGAGGLRFVHNTVLALLTGADYTPTDYGAGSSAIALSEDMHDLVIDNNLMAGGSYTMYGPSQAGSAPANVHVTNNHFSTEYYPGCGFYGVHTGFDSSAPGFEWSGNVFHETGEPVGP